MSDQEKEYETLKDQLRNGCICSAWGDSYLFSVNPAPGIDRVRLSLVKKNTGGKESNDFYMKISDFRRLCEDIDSGLAWKRISADKEKYPSAYKFVTGENGSKVLTLGGSRKNGYARVQITIENSFMVSPVSGAELREMSFLFKLVMGLIPCSRYYKSLIDVFWEGINEREEKAAKYKNH